MFVVSQYNNLMLFPQLPIHVKMKALIILCQLVLMREFQHISFYFRDFQPNSLWYALIYVNKYNYSGYVYNNYIDTRMGVKYNVYISWESD